MNNQDLLLTPEETGELAEWIARCRAILENENSSRALAIAALYQVEGYVRHKAQLAKDKIIITKLERHKALIKAESDGYAYELLEAKKQIAKVKAYCEDCADGFISTHEKATSELFAKAHQLNRPELREKIRDILSAIDDDSISRHGLHGYIINEYVKQVLVLFPDEEAIRNKLIEQGWMPAGQEKVWEDAIRLDERARISKEMTQLKGQVEKLQVDLLEWRDSIKRQRRGV